MTDWSRIPRIARDRLRWPLRLTFLGLIAERGLRAFWPVWSLLFALLAALAFGIGQALPAALFWTGLLVLLIAVIGFGWHGWRRFRWPSRAEALERLDASLPGRPIAALGDSQALGQGDPASRAVWQAHLARMTARAAAARRVAPDLRLARFDPFALRYVALLAFVMALGFGSFGRIGQIGRPELGTAGTRIAGPAWEGWVQPPPYTGKPSLYLNEITGTDLKIPAGSKISLRLYGARGALRVAEDLSGKAGKPADPGAAEQSFIADRSGKLSIAGPGGRSWQVAIIPDRAPRVAVAGKLVRMANGKMRLPFHASDDYGVTAGTAVITLDLAAVDRRYGLAVPPEPRKPITLDLPMPITGSRADFTQVLIDDLSQDAWANLPVDITLSVRDAAGQTGSVTETGVILPGRRFFDPLAAAVIEMRRDLLWSRANAERSDEILRAVTWKPEGFIQNTSAYLQLRVVMQQLEGGMAKGLSVPERDAVAVQLWKIAVLLEDGTLSDALQQLRAAQDRLSEAIRRGASKDEIDRLMAEMNRALQNYVQRLAEQQSQNPNRQSAQNQPSMTITGQQMQQLLQRLQQLMEQGRMAEAQQLLDRLRQLTENMRLAQGKDGMQIPGQQAMKGLTDTLRQQQGLSDQAFQNLQRQFGQQGQGQQPGQQQGMGQQGMGQPGQGQPSGQSPGAGQGAGQGLNGQDLAQRQGALRQQLDQQRQGDLPGAGTADGRAARDALGRAGKAMDEAEQALRNNDLPRALDNQAQAMDALREGLRHMDRAMAQNNGQPGQPGSEDEAQGADGSSRQTDPLGRQVGRGTSVGTDGNLLQGQDVYRRAQQILEELRKRAGDQSRPLEERQYLKRLLDQF